MKTKLALATASALALFALTAGAPASAASTHGLSCKAGTQATRVMEKGKHVWRCETPTHHNLTPSSGTMAPKGTMAPSKGTSY
ncbi:hypothetical protein K32_36070 [Kaistia sp. 32K]|uniref:hypothetical protein n=1 Tax=Kaistia sp. 32K TaxID=2795690 RepID=UPI001916629E|nr:hypothetical protein [Kaistia sp. 32K]BCP54990.1 hypothetical protein K32_36070 [Kaistia sp. 32K]